MVIAGSYTIIRRSLIWRQTEVAVADICMCANQECLLRSSCYRATAIPDKFWQAYAQFDPKVVDANDKPECHFPNKGKRNRRV